MIVLGLIFLLLGYLLSISILTTIGWIALAIGVIFLVFGAVGYTIGGRKYWW